MEHRDRQEYNRYGDDFVSDSSVKGRTKRKAVSEEAKLEADRFRAALQFHSGNKHFLVLKAASEAVYRIVDHDTAWSKPTWHGQPYPNLRYYSHKDNAYAPTGGFESSYRVNYVEAGKVRNPKVHYYMGFYESHESAAQAIKMVQDATQQQAEAKQRQSQAARVPAAKQQKPKASITRLLPKEPEQQSSLFSLISNSAAPAVSGSIGNVASITQPHQIALREPASGSSNEYVTAPVITPAPADEYQAVEGAIYMDLGQLPCSSTAQNLSQDMSGQPMASFMGNGQYLPLNQKPPAVLPPQPAVVVAQPAVQAPQPQLIPALLPILDFTQRQKAPKPKLTKVSFWSVQYPDPLHILRNPPTRIRGKIGMKEPSPPCPPEFAIVGDTEVPWFFSVPGPGKQLLLPNLPQFANIYVSTATFDELFVRYLNETQARRIRDGSMQSPATGQLESGPLLKRRKPALSKIRLMDVNEFQWDLMSQLIGGEVGIRRAASIYVLQRHQIAAATGLPVKETKVNPKFWEQVLGKPFFDVIIAFMSSLYDRFPHLFKAYDPKFGQNGKKAKSAFNEGVNSFLGWQTAYHLEEIKQYPWELRKKHGEGAKDHTSHEADGNEAAGDNENSDVEMGSEEAAKVLEQFLQVNPEVREVYDQITDEQEKQEAHDTEEETQ